MLNYYKLKSEHINLKAFEQRLQLPIAHPGQFGVYGL
jgi:hypothetical protein